MEYLLCYGIIQFGNLDGGKRHDDGQARYEPRSLAFSSHTNPPHHRRYLPAHAIRFLHLGCIRNEFPKLHNKASWRLLLHFAIICTLNNSYAFTESGSGEVRADLGSHKPVRVGKRRPESTASIRSSNNPVTVIDYANSNHNPNHNHNYQCERCRLCLLPPRTGL